MMKKTMFNTIYYPLKNLISTRTSTILMSNTKISISRRHYPGGLPTGSAGGIGKGPKLPNGTSSGTNLPPSNKEGINLTPSQAQEALSSKNSQPYIPPQHITEAEKSSSTPTTSNFPKPITPYQSKDPFKVSTIEEKIQKANILPKVEEKPSSKISEEILKKLQEGEQKSNEEWKSQHKNGIKESLFPTKNSTFNEPTYPKPTTSPILELKESENTLQPQSPLPFEEEKTNASSMPPVFPPIKPKILKNISGKDYTTKINETTTTISYEDLIKELKSRELIKEDNGNTAVPIKTQDGSFTQVGESINHVKVTPLGQAYLGLIKKSPIISTHNISSNDKNYDFMIVTPPRPNENTFIESGKQKHLLLAHYKRKSEDKGEEEDVYYAIGYLTSKKTAKEICDIQFKKFQEQQENIDGLNNIKKQNFVPFYNAEILNKEDVEIAWQSKKYLSELDNNILDYFHNLAEDLQKKPCVIFDKNGITAEDCLEICKQHDIHVINKTKHPLTKDQIQQQQEAKEIQQEKQKEEKESKNKNNNKFKHDQTTS